MIRAVVQLSESSVSHCNCTKKSVGCYVKSSVATDGEVDGLLVTFFFKKFYHLLFIERVRPEHFLPILCAENLCDQGCWRVCKSRQFPVVHWRQQRSSDKDCPMGLRRKFWWLDHSNRIECGAEGSSPEGCRKTILRWLFVWPLSEQFHRAGFISIRGSIRAINLKVNQ